MPNQWNIMEYEILLYKEGLKMVGLLLCETADSLVH